MFLHSITKRVFVCSDMIKKGLEFWFPSSHGRETELRLNQVSGRQNGKSTMLPKNLAPSTLAQQILPRQPLILLDMCFQHAYCTSLDTCRCFLPISNSRFAWLPKDTSTKTSQKHCRMKSMLETQTIVNKNIFGPSSQHLHTAVSQNSGDPQWKIRVMKAFMNCWFDLVVSTT